MADDMRTNARASISATIAISRALASTLSLENRGRRVQKFKVAP